MNNLPSGKATLRWLMKQFKAARWSLLLALLLALTTAISGMALLGVAGWFIGASALAGIAAMGAAHTFNLFSPSAGIRGFALGRTVSRYLERLISHKGTFEVMQHLRTRLFALIIPRIPGALSHISQGHLLERLFKDVERLEAAWLEQAQPALLASGISLALIAFLLITGQYQGAALMSLFFMAMVLWLHVSNKDALTPINTISQQQEALRSDTVQALTGLPEVIAYNIRDRLLQKWQDSFADLSAAEQDLVRRQAINGAFLQGAIQIAAVVVLLLALPLIQADTMAAPLGLATLLLILGAVEVYQPLARTALRCWETRSTVARMQAMEATPLGKAACQGEDIPVAGGELYVEGLSFGWHPHRPLFQQLSFTASPNNSIAIVGPSGTGKSTLLHCLMGLQAATEGTIRYGQTHQHAANEQAWRDQFSLLLQQQQLFTGTLRDNLKIANPKATDEELWEALRLARLAKLAEQRGGLDFTIGPEGLHLSGGQARRLALARVLLRDAPIVLLDEPFTGLETNTADALMKDIKEVLKGKILIMVTHHKAHSKMLDQTIYL